jgi:hypothetical protein
MNTYTYVSSVLIKYIGFIELTELIRERTFINSVKIIECKVMENGEKLKTDHCSA